MLESGAFSLDKYSPCSSLDSRTATDSPVNLFGSSSCPTFRGFRRATNDELILLELRRAYDESVLRTRPALVICKHCGIELVIGM